jgi:hypothetical protein
MPSYDIYIFWMNSYDYLLLENSNVFERVHLKLSVQINFELLDHLLRHESYANPLTCITQIAKNLDKKLLKILIMHARQP